MANAIDKRRAVNAEPLHKRQTWAQANRATYPYCGDCEGAGRICAYAQHYAGVKLDAAFLALAGGGSQDAQAQDAQAQDAQAQAGAQAQDAQAQAGAQAQDAQAQAQAAIKAGQDALLSAQAAPNAAAQIQAAIQAIVQATAVQVDETALLARVESMIEERVKAVVPRTLHIKVGDRAAVNVGVAHRQYPLLLKMVTGGLDGEGNAQASGINVWIAGPAGSGKTTAAEQVAQALALPFYFNGAIDSEYKLNGFIDAQGRIVSTAFRKAFTEGGIYLFDEIDRSLPNALLAFNAALANGYADFPGCDSPVKRHCRAIIMAAANTWGFGGDANYVGAMKQDAAFLDRFVQLSWEYDENLERSIAASFGAQGVKEALDWCSKVQTWRVKARARGLKIVISPRATINGCKLFAAGLTESQVIDATIRAKITAQDWDNLNK